MLESLFTGFLSNTKNKAPCLVKFYISIHKHMKFGTCVYFLFVIILNVPYFSLKNFAIDHNPCKPGLLVL